MKTIIKEPERGSSVLHFKGICNTCGTRFICEDKDVFWMERNILSLKEPHATCPKCGKTTWLQIISSSDYKYSYDEANNVGFFTLLLVAIVGMVAGFVLMKLMDFFING